MQWEIVLLVLVGAGLHAGWNVLIKAESDTVFNAVLIAAGSSFAGVAVLPFFPLPAPACWPYLAGSVLIHTLYFSLLVLAYKKGDLSLVYPLMRGIPPVLTAALAAVLLNESYSWKGWLGVVLVSGGALLLAADFRFSSRFRMAPMSLGLLNALVIVVYTLIDGTGARLSGNAFSYTGWMLFLTSGLFFMGILIAQGRQIAVRVVRQWRKGAIGGLCAFGSYGIALWAMTKAPIALVASLRETSILFGTVLAVFTLRERITKWRLISILLIAGGVIAIKLS